jgi:DNA topoisomerase-2
LPASFVIKFDFKDNFLKSNQTMPPKKATSKYSKMEPVDHILNRPEMYVGASKVRPLTEYIYDGEHIVQSTIESSPAVLRIFIEPLSNAIDNAKRSLETKTPSTKIKISIDQETGETSVWNDGDIVPVEMNEEQGIYNHTLIFGNLLTGSNYDDDEERVVSGRNGLGVKLTSIFSSSFQVKGCDPVNGKILTQDWKNNMKDTTGPKIVKSALKKGYTHVTWTPDFKRFGLTSYTDDIVNLYKRYIIDAAMLSTVQVSLNGEVININNLKTYAAMYKTPSDDCVVIKHKGSEVVVTPSNEFQAISFVNGVFTKLGGQHVDAWSEAIFRPIVDKLNKAKKPQINIRDVKGFFRLFVVSTVVNPEFDGQDKQKLESPTIEAVIKTSVTTAMMKWSVIDDIRDIISSKEMGVLRKVERKKKFTKIEGLDPANNAGGKFSKDCTLIVCEGLSAKTYAVAGIEKGVYQKKGRDWFGIYPLRGKILNVRNSVPATIAKNAVVTDLIQSLGVRHGVDYTDPKNFAELHYGKIMVMTDADVDGIHIEGLLMNLVHYLFPSLLERKEPYIVSMKTPIVRVFRPRMSDLLFYDEKRFKAYALKQTKPFKKKYYKGLGSTKPEDVPDTFGLKMVEYTKDDASQNSMTKAFHKKSSDARKDWLAHYNENIGRSLDDVGETTEMTMSAFVDGELIKFSMDDCKRSIPNGIDGLKESMRKILYAVKKRKLSYTKETLKVAQLGGYVAEHSNYHHGEQNLYDTIVKMANEFPGSNNVPLLYRDGMFGTRLAGGKDSASPRYIFTKMDALTELIFRKEDDPLLSYIMDDGDSVEPEFYIPILPMILVNGCTAGIGTGWSCNVPCYNPRDLVDCIKAWLAHDCRAYDGDDGEILISNFPEITPWYRGFTGTIEPSGENRYITHGRCTVGLKIRTTVVDELPIGMWTDKFKDMCDTLMEEKEIRAVRNYSTPKKVEFVITESPEGNDCTVDSLKLHTYLYTSNIVTFDEKGVLKKHPNVESVLDDFCKVRYEYYIKRKAHMVGSLEEELRFLGNKERFVREVIEEDLIIMNQPEEEILTELEDREYDKHKASVDANGEEIGGYSYLLSMQVRTFTYDKVKTLKNDIASARTTLDTILRTSEKDMWIAELNEFQEAYVKWEKVIENRPVAKGKKK